MMPHCCSDVTPKRCSHGNRAGATRQGDEPHEPCLLQIFRWKQKERWDVMKGNHPSGDGWLSLTRQKRRSNETERWLIRSDLINYFSWIYKGVKMSIPQEIQHRSQLLQLLLYTTSQPAIFSLSFSIAHSLNPPSRINKNLFWASPHRAFQLSGKPNTTKAHTVATSRRNPWGARAAKGCSARSGHRGALHAQCAPSSLYLPPCPPAQHVCDILYHKGWKKRDHVKVRCSVQFHIHTSS